MAVVGSVGVEVVPDARGWSSKLRAQILPEADRIGKEIGKRIGDAAGAEARRRIAVALKDLKATVNVDADTGKARAEIEALKKEANKAPGKGPGLLLTTILGLGTALVPLGAIAAASFGAIAEGAGVAFLAFEGIKEQMKIGSQLGKAYAAGLDTVNDGMERLSTIAAQGVFAGFNKSVKDISALMPGLSTTTALFANALGDAGSHVVHGLLAGFVKLQPLMDDLLGSATRTASKFDAFASGSGLQKFGDWAQANLPAIADDIAQVAKAVEHLLIASAASGVNILNVLGALARAINAIPIGVLQVFVPLVTTLVLAWKGYAAVAGIIYSVNKAMLANTAAATAMAAANEEAAAAGGAGAASRGLGRGAGPPVFLGGGPIGILGGLAVGGLIGHQALDTQAKKPGLFGRISNALISTPGLGPTHIGGGTDPAKAAHDLALNSAANTTLAAALGQRADATLAATEAAKKDAATVATQTLAMQVAGDAAGLLSQALNKLGGNNLGVAEATAANAQATRDATKALHDNGNTLSLNTEKGLANRTALDASARSSINLALAVGQNTHSTLRANDALEKSKSRLEDALRAQGNLTPAIQRYIDTIFKIPPRRLTTVDLKILGQQRLAEFQRQLSLLHSFAITVTANVVKGGAPVFGHPILAGGGWVRGPGTGTSDSVVANVSNGEFVVNAADAARNAGLLEQINKGVAAWAQTSPASAMNYGPGTGGTTITINEVTDPVGTANAVTRRMHDLGRV